MARKVLKQVKTQKRNDEATILTTDFVAPRIKLSFDGEPRFFINKQKGAIACKIYSHISMPSEMQLIDNYMVWDRNGMPRNYEFATVGVVRLHKGEKWDEKLGMRLAESKAKKQAYTAGFNYINSVLQDTLKDLKSILDFRKSMKDLISHEDDHFDQLTESVN